MNYEGVRARSAWLLSRLPLRIIAVSVGVLAGFVLLSVRPSAGAVPTTVDRFLGTLTLAQASVLAIVFSVVILAVQLTASKYSNQITDIYVRSPVFVATFSLFLISIGFDLALLYSYPMLPDALTSSLVYVAAGLSVVVAVWLVYFIQFTFTQLTPEGIVSMFEEDLTTTRSLDLLRATPEEDLEEMNHPLLPLHSLTVQAIRNDERFTALRALREFGIQLVRVFEETDRSLDEETLELLYEPALTVYLPEIIELGGEADVDELAEGGLDWIHRIGRAAVDASADPVARIASEGFERVIDRHAADPARSRTFVTAWETWGSLVTELCAGANVGTIQHAFSGFEQQLNRIDDRGYDDRVRQEILFCFFTDLQDCHETLLNRFAADVDGLDVPWDRRFLPTGDDRERTAAQLLVKCRNLFVRFSSIVLDHLVETGDYPIRFNSFQGLWADVCSFTVHHAPREYARTICEIYIEVAFLSVLHERTGPGTVGERRRAETWASTLRRLARTEEGAPVDAAFDAVLDEDRVRYLSVRSYPPITETDAYPELVERLRATAEA